MRPVRRPITALATALLAGGALLAVGVAPAAAASGTDVDTPGIRWQGVSNNALMIDDATSKYDDFRGMGVDFARGFTEDAFNGMLLELRAHYAGGDQLVALTPASTSWVDGGLSTVTANGYVDFGNGRDLNVAITLQIQGNYARWTFTSPGGLPGATFSVAGAAGSGFDTVVVPAGPTSLVTHDTSGSDPIIGYQLVGTGGSVSAGADGGFSATFPVAGTSSIVVALQDYTPCGRDDAIAQMTARAASLSATFGETIDLADSGTCLAIAAPVSFAAGAQTDQQLTVTPDARIASDMQMAIDNGWVRLATTGLPSGLSLAFDPATQALRLTGTAAQGTYPVQVLVYQQVGIGNVAPYFTTLQVTVGAAAPAAAPQLADSGADANTPYVAGAGALLLLAGALVLGVRRVRARR